MNQREVTEEELSLANKLKSEGNQLMKDKKFEGQLYSQGRCKKPYIFQMLSQSTPKPSRFKKALFTTATEPPLMHVLQKDA